MPPISSRPSLQRNIPDQAPRPRLSTIIFSKMKNGSWKAAVGDPSEPLGPASEIPSDFTRADLGSARRILGRP